MTRSLGFDAAAIALFALFAILGAAVSRSQPGAIDRRAAKLRARGMPPAIFFTKCGRSLPLCGGYAAAIAIYAAAHMPVLIPILLAVSQLLSQLAVEVFKTLFRRTRPDYWLIGREAGHSYPSGHSTTAIVSFAGWACVAASSALPGALRIVAAAALAVWAVGILWSRLALGAHYLSDVAGGVFFGGAWLFALCAVTSFPH